MIRFLSVWFLMVMMIQANPQRFETTFFSSDQEKFTLDFSLKESEFSSYIQQHPHHLSKSPLLIVSFVIPSPFFSNQGNRLLFYSDHEHRKLVRQFSFMIASSAIRFDPMVIGGNKKFHSFGFENEFQHTFYLILPSDILIHKKFNLVIRETGKDGDRDTQIPFYYSQINHSFMTERQLKDEKIIRRLEGEQAITSIDISGQLFFKIELNRSDTQIMLSIQVKNISGRIQSFDPNQVILTIPGCGHLKPRSDKTSDKTMLRDGEFAAVSIGFELPELPRLDLTRCDLSYHRGSIRFQKELIL
ncbi:MAG: hypothetical protein KBA26_00465 [Candidatus Delongbacteria bacterium]|nr:hypothetical protein [Candidatus Delongbacteria bacterium]